MGELLSMTGFGRNSAQRNDLHVTAEIRTVNNRYLEISSRISRSLSDFEIKAKEIIRSYLDRGRIYLVLNDLSPRIRISEARLDEALSEALLEHLRNLSHKLGLKDEVTLQHILPFADDIRGESFDEIPSELFEVAGEALEGALQKLKNMRRREGSALESDFRQRLSNIELGIEKAESIADNNTKIRLEKLRERISSLIQMKELDPYRLEIEAAILADKSDITEELVRLKSHCSQFAKILDKGSPCGRKLDFLVQEMNRELNTSSSKADIAEMSHLVVEMKEGLERIREQAQNVE